MSEYLFNFHNVAALVAILSGIAQPYISALLTRAPSWLTGVLTSLQSAAAGLVAELVIAPDNYNWGKAVGTAISAWLLAFATQQLHLSGTRVQRKLHGNGGDGRHTEGS